ncbi:MAG: cytochrome c oxidase subunit 3 [Pyrinomonadaceae bacterium]
MSVPMVNTRTAEKPRDRVNIGLKGGPGSRPNGNGSRGPKGGGGGGGSGKDGDHSPHQQYRIGMWVALASIMMLFAALTSAYVFRADSTQTWQTFGVPSLMWVSTGLILLSSVTYEIARRSLKRDFPRAYQRWLVVSLLLGVGFLLTQVLAWRQLVAQGIYLATNPHSSFFYLLTALHGLHLLLGVLGLSYLWLRTLRARHTLPDARASERERAGADAMGIYWHFMDGLWVYLFGLLFLWR